MSSERWWAAIGGGAFTFVACLPVFRMASLTIPYIGNRLLGFAAIAGTEEAFWTAGIVLSAVAGLAAFRWAYHHDTPPPSA